MSHSPVLKRGILGGFLLRWVDSHVIEEHARHNGHADLLRQCVDGEAAADTQPGSADNRRAGTAWMPLFQR